MAVLSPVVEPLADLLVVFNPQLFERSPVGPKPIRHDGFRLAISLYGLAQKRQCCMAILALRDVGLEDLAFVIDSAPEVVGDTVDLHEHLVEVPLPLRPSAQPARALSPDLRGEHRPEPVPPVPDCFMAHLDTALVEKVLHVP